MSKHQGMIKVCGMRDAENIRQVEALGVDMMGLIFWPRSSRYVSEPPDYLPETCRRVGVFVDETPEQIRKTAADYRLDYVQLHGHESPEYVRQLRGLKLIKAFSIGSPEDIAACKPYEGLVDYFLFDTKGPSAGGNGTQFDWTVLADYVGETPFLLSGGIGPEDAGRILDFRHPKCIGVDLNSRFEVAPGLKDVAKLKSFLEKLII